jgi:AAHS family 4-hydroxybenzoate transporter-like MFS transporter
MAVTINVAELIDRHGFGGFQIRIVALCFLVLIFDGFDAQVIGYVAPALVGALHLDRSMLAPIFSVGLVGYGCGSIIFGTLADRFGRKPMLVCSALCFGFFTVLKATSTSFELLLLWQFVAGLGIAGATPNAVALIVEYSPKRLRATLTTAALCGFLIGSTIGGLISAFLIPLYGWQSVFYVGGIAPLLIVPLLVWGVPESARFMIVHRAPSIRIMRIVRQIIPSVDIASDATFLLPEVDARGFSVTSLFRDGRATTTLLLWTTMFMSLLVTYFLLNWLPVLVNGAGLSVQEAVLATTMFPLGGVIGTLLLGWLIDRYWAPTILAIAYAIFAICTALAGPSSVSFIALAIVLTGAGVGAGAQMGMNAFAGLVYPTAMKGTGVGWMVGIGRTGSMIGPLLGGALVALKWPVSSILLVSALPAAIAALSTYLIGRLPRSAAMVPSTVRREATAPLNS